MNNYSKKFILLKKSDIIIKNNKLHIADAIDNNITKQKLIFKINKFKKDKKENSERKNQNFKKLSAKEDNDIKKEKMQKYYKETMNEKKLVNSKSFNYGRSKTNLKINKSGMKNIKNKISKKVNGNSRNHKNFFENYEKNKIKKKMIIKNGNNKNDNMNKTYINNNCSLINQRKYANSYFNTLFINNDENKNDDENNFSLSQNIPTKKNNLLRKINTNLIEYNDKLKNDISGDKHEYNRSYSNFSKSKSKTGIYSNYPFNNDTENNNNFYIESNNNNKKINNYTSKNVNKETEKLQNNQSIDLLNENNTTINLADSYNLHQYFNTIINNKHSNYINNSLIRKNNLINRNYNKNKTIIGNYNKKVYNNINYCHTQILNSNENNSKKSNNIFINDKFIEEINKLKNNMIKKLLQNPTNSKSKKYNTLKDSFEKLLKLFNEYFFNNNNTIYIFLQNILIGYHEVVCAFSEENRKFKLLNYKLSEQYEKVDKNLIECNKIIKEKQNKIESLENKLYNLMNNLKKPNFNNIQIKNDYMNLNNNFFEKYKFTENKDLKIPNKGKSEQFIKIKKINENNLNDLDSLYFFDKIEKKHQKSFSFGKIIPILPINKL